ncbi:MAG: thioredoxin domain-containing protein [Methanoregulaceae archaeon]|nr:thioredoxin domain-containing protein [Methanoregulaceae archaeon]
MMDDTGTSPQGTEKNRPNRLIHEKSPYLLQHAYNPVAWYPWGEEAFDNARTEDKPLFVSIGYSTCHWCHVMKRESFEDPDVASALNDTFICIKVDREERPDIDQLYISAAQIMTGSGGWPLTICMTPDKIPFYAATYIPPESRYGITGMRDLIPRIRKLWKTQRADLITSGHHVLDLLTRDQVQKEGRMPDLFTLDRAFESLAAMYDSEHGGFGKAPKFPMPHTLIFLLRYGYRTGDARAFQMVRMTLDSMAVGGIHDQIGSGFHRYSTDTRWILPHFEKMLYDQALLAMAYTEGYLALGKGLYREVAMQTLDYVLREMTDPEGGFYSAEDAESEGIEGNYYLWTKEELKTILDPDEQNVVFPMYRIRSSGNFIDPATGERTGRNILYRVISPDTGVENPENAEEVAGEVLNRARAKMIRARDIRVRPGKDDKIITDWNGLMIAALAGAARAFDNPAYLRAAERAAHFILRRMRNDDGSLLHRYRKGETAIPGGGQDYACLIFGLIALYEAGFDTRFLRSAIELERFFTKHCWDQEKGGYFSYPDTNRDLPVRMKEFYDGALPSCNSVAFYLHILLARITGDPVYERRGAGIARAFAAAVQERPSPFAFFLAGLDHALGPSVEVVLAGRRDDPGLVAMQRFINTRYAPRLVLLLRPDDKESPDITRLAPFTAPFHTVGGLPSAYLCTGAGCHQPVTSVAELGKLLDAAPRQI